MCQGSIKKAVRKESPCSQSAQGSTGTLLGKGHGNVKAQGASLITRASNAQARQRERGGRRKKAPVLGCARPHSLHSWQQLLQRSLWKTPQEGTITPMAVLALLQRQPGGSH